MDVADRPSVDAAMARVRKELGPIAILVVIGILAVFVFHLGGDFRRHVAVFVRVKRMPAIAGIRHP